MPPVQIQYASGREIELLVEIGGINSEQKDAIISRLLRLLQESEQ